MTKNKFANLALAATALATTCASAWNISVGGFLGLETSARLRNKSDLKFLQQILGLGHDVNNNGNQQQIVNDVTRLVNDANARPANAALIGDLSSSETLETKTSFGRRFFGGLSIYFGFIEIGDISFGLALNPYLNASKVSTKTKDKEDKTIEMEFSTPFGAQLGIYMKWHVIQLELGLDLFRRNLKTVSSKAHKNYAVVENAINGMRPGLIPANPFPQADVSDSSLGVALFAKLGVVIPVGSWLELSPFITGTMNLRTEIKTPVAGVKVSQGRCGKFGVGFSGRARFGGG